MAYKFVPYAPEGSGGDNTVVDVTELPTENVDDGKIYRKREEKSVNVWVVGKLGNDEINMSVVEVYSMMMGTSVTAPIYVVDALPDEMEAMDEETLTIPTYIIESTGVAYTSEDGTPASAFPVSSMLRGSDGGWVDSIDDITMSDKPVVYSVRGGSFTTYGVPNSQKNKYVYEYQPDGEWVNSAAELKACKSKIDSLTAEKETLTQTVTELQPYADFAKHVKLGTLTNTSGLGTLVGVGGVNEDYGYDDPYNRIESLIVPLGVEAIGTDLGDGFRSFHKLKTLYLPRTIKFLYTNVVTSQLKEVYYDGTVGEFATVKSTQSWDGIVIHCTDGDTSVVRNID